MKKFKAIFFLISFCFSITGHTFELHYCQGEVTDISLIGHADCVCSHSQTEKEEKKSGSHCQKHCHPDTNNEVKNQVEIEKESCCKTEKLTFLSPTVKALSNTDIPVWTVAVAILNPGFFIRFVDEQAVDQLVYIPPILDRDITILHRTFLI